MEMLSLAGLLFASAFLLLAGKIITVYLRFASIPGPFLAGFTDLWRWRAQNSRGYSARLVHLHQTYGKLVRLGPNHISISDPDAVPIVYTTNPVWHKAPSYHPAAPISGGRAVPSIIAMTEAQHTAVRRSVGSAFTTNSLLDYESAIEASGNDLLEALEKQTSLDITHYLQLWAVDVLMRLAFNESLGFMQKGDDVDGILEAIVGRFDHWGHWSAVPTLEYYLFKSPFASFVKKKANSALARVGLEKIQARSMSQSQMQNRDLMQKFLDGQAKHPDLVSHDEILGIIMSTIGAGADTTAGTMTYTLYLLCQNPEAMQGLKDELQQALENGSMTYPPKWTQVNRLPYLEAVLKESMRLMPIAAWGLDRVVPQGGATICGHYFPAGTVVGCQIDATMLDEDVYGRDSALFRPERWMEAAEDQRRRMDRAFIAFSAGKRICMGIHIAWLELKKALPLLVMNFDMALVNPNQNLKEEIRISAVKYAPPIWMSLCKKEVTSQG
ncbi:cytochrome P450 [Exophiala viscosa]|uniref:cytochrome P450 n=1 Tax=Exophiala viscosa TaxID=2486360 RepID=UPI00219CA361|nr:cytochrome P450 [Exophiala viscosa]